jgi:putative nucleotidyltransferase with HDIG domain
MYYFIIFTDKYSVFSPVAHLRSYHVAAGSFTVGAVQPKILQAFLGTCVGVSLVDRSVGIGGLIHLLLPEPTSSAVDDQPAKYATTGMPLFLDSLYRAGGRRENLRACVAGGALIGPVEDLDLALDIGGRTAEIVLAFLEKRNVTIEKVETGGFHACTLSLDLQTLKAFIRPIEAEKPAAPSEAGPATKEEILTSMEKLTPIPQVALKVLRMTDEDRDIKALAAEVAKDQVMGAKTLRLCNSVLYSGRNRIESIDQALVLLGTKLLIKFIVSASINTYFSQVGGGYSLCKGGMYQHAVGTAVVAETLAAATGRVKPSLAYTAGLIHDIGKVVLDQHVSSALPYFYRELFENRSDVMSIERSTFGIDHCETGGLLASNWELPGSMREAMRYHHCPEKATHQPQLAHIVHLSDLLLSRFQTGLELERMDTSRLTSRMAAVGLAIDDLPGLVDRIPANVFEPPPDMPPTNATET